MEELLSGPAAQIRGGTVALSWAEQVTTMKGTSALAMVINR